ncbi:MULTISPECIES: MliC family protein [unclassified Stenotrophomonas]|jgi:uncharacterized protein|uniref:MliC family protein n=1 Tax=unclassified Stenotrophomonas TaxID=196198 RepID=UPI0028A919F0|nr:MliC family protein [Stenotrophomonas sp.]
MNRIVLSVAVALVVAGCSRSPEPADPASPAAAPAARTAPVALPAAPSDTATATPSFDCAKATSDAEKWVCTDEGLAALDRQLAARYKRAQTAPDEVDIAAEQRGWIKGRDACTRAVDPRQCLREAYQTRLVELTVSGGGVPASATGTYRCDDADKPLKVVFYNDIDPAAAIVTLGTDQAIVFPIESASGSRYGREGVAFWEHQGEATLDFYGTALRCTADR